MDRRHLYLAGCAIAGAVALAASAAGAADTAHGQKLVRQRCTSCHTAGDGDGDGDIGPSLKGVVGRKVAGAPDFTYTAQLQAVQGLWTAPRLEAFLEDPSRIAPGSAMTTRVPQAQDREDIVAYLASIK